MVNKNLVHQFDSVFHYTIHTTIRDQIEEHVEKWGKRGGWVIIEDGLIMVDRAGTALNTKYHS